MRQDRADVIRGYASTGLVNRFPDAAPHEAIVAWFPRLDDIEASNSGSGEDGMLLESSMTPARPASGSRPRTRTSRSAPSCSTIRTQPSPSSKATAASPPRWARRSSCSTCGSYPSATAVSRKTSRCCRPASTSQRPRASRITLAIETIPCSIGSPLENVGRALERDDRCRVTLDTEFLARHGQLDAALVDDSLWERVVHIHVKDCAGSLRDRDGTRRYLIAGEGMIDFNRVFDTLHRRAYEGALTLEVSAVTADGDVDEQRVLQAEAWLASRPWLVPV